MNVGATAVAVSMSVLMFYGGTLFDKRLFLAQFGGDRLRDFGGVIVANYIVVPLLTLCAIRFLSFPPVVNLVLLTMAMLPCAPLVPAFVGWAGKPAEQSLFFFLSMSIINIVMVPVLVEVLALPWTSGSDVVLRNDEGPALMRYVLSIYGPLSLGAAFRLLAPQRSIPVQQVLRRVMPWLMLATTLIFVVSYWRDLLDMGAREFGALAIFEVICVAVGLAFAQYVASGRLASVLLSSMRNFAMGIAFTSIVFPHTAAPSTMMVFTGLLSIGTALGLIVRGKFVHRIEARP